MPKWTPQQLDAIQREGNLLVAAAAGAGKTAVLTERIVERVRRGADIRSILVVTFTKAAAGEMKKRVIAALLEAAQASPEEAERLREAAERVQDASISTLHAFCLQVLRRHFYEAALDPAFRVADEARSAVLLEDALDELMESRVEEPEVRALCDLLGGEDKLSSALLSLHAFLQAQPAPDKWMEEALALYALDAEGLDASKLVQGCIARAKRALAAALTLYQDARDAVADAFPAAAAFADAELLSLRPALLANGYTAYADAINAFAFGRLTGFPRGTEEEKKAPFMEARDEVKRCVKEQRKGFARAIGEEAARMRGLCEPVATLFACLRGLEALYGEKKRAAGLIDYGDMEHMTLHILNRPEIRNEYRRKFSYVLVDEYQDSNRVQEAILDAVKGADNLFLVGDVKQSIYRFRQAAPALFMEKYHTPACFHGDVIDLNRNFRSADAVIDAVNALFSRTMTRDFGGVDYDARSALVKGRSDASAGGVEVHMLQCDEEDEWESAEAEAVFAARRIREIMRDERYTDPKTGKTRPYAYGDFAVLHRSPRAVAERMTQLMALQGVPAYAELTGGYFDAVEVQVFMNLLRVIDNRRQDIPLLSVMRSMMGGFTDEELGTLRLLDTQAPWVELLEKAAQNGGALGAKARGFLDKLDAWNMESRLVRVAALCAALMDETGYSAYCASLPGGRVRRANLDALIERAAAYEESEARSLSGFIAFMDRIKNTDRIGASAVLGADVVRLLSTHKSKGLEFPVVILAGLSKKFNAQERRQDIALHETLGLGMRYIEGNVRRDTLARGAILDENSDAALEEELRILYVAMTRARERLILLISEKDIEASVKKHCRPVTPYLCANAARESDWLLWALLDTPDGDPLRAYAGLPALGGRQNAHVAAQVGVRACERPSKESYAAFAARAQNADAGYWQTRFAWAYPYLVDTQIPGKISVSELIGNLPSMRAYPDFIAAKKPLDAADRGTAAHLLMELIPLKAHTVQSVRDCIETLVERGHMTRAQAEAVRVEPVVAFFASPLGKRLCAAELVERERGFNYRVPARRAISADTDEPMLLQGVIDCCFRENGAWVVIDYKTDRVSAGKAYETAAKHQRQLDVYADALAALTGEPVKEKYIHLLMTGESVAL
ncbi:MAG: helicase-exonuclease AddAB subunit AddA [Eubacteriales bacterium]|nr:helicase-exonuclease AddAB subunit AddA [Eubacteriales bacterium]